MGQFVPSEPPAGQAWRRADPGEELTGKEGSQTLSADLTSNATSLPAGGDGAVGHGLVPIGPVGTTCPNRCPTHTSGMTGNQRLASESVWNPSCVCKFVAR